MPDQKIDSGVGHVVVPVHVGDGEVHHVAVPADANAAEFHKALIDHVTDHISKMQGAPTSDGSTYVGDMRISGDQPSKEGVVENSPEFKAAARSVWHAAGEGRRTDEAGVGLDEDLNQGKVERSEKDGKATLKVPAGTKYLLHSHPDYSPELGKTTTLPSDKDIATAKALNMPLYVVSRKGLTMVDGRTGKTTVVFSDPHWMDEQMAEK